MKIVRFWRKAAQTIETPEGGALELMRWGWSDISEEEAHRVAQTRLHEAIEKCRSATLDEFFDWRNARDYYPLHGFVREEIVREIRDENGELTACITRNSYGAQVLNTARLAFIDIDAPVGCLTSLFMGRNAEKKVRQRIVEAIAEYPNETFRLYRTAAGFRVMITSRALEPVSTQAAQMMEAFGCDRLYRKLCVAQESFRARLTPKSWRVSVAPPYHRFPFTSAAQEQRYREWQNEYEAACARFATCRFIGELGSVPMLAELAPLVKLHDEITRAHHDETTPLA